MKGVVCCCLQTTRAFAVQEQRYDTGMGGVFVSLAAALSCKAEMII